MVFGRKTQPAGPLAVFGYDYFEVEWAKRGHTTKPKLLEYEGLWGGGEEYAYEVLNFADGKRMSNRFAMPYRRSTVRCRWRWLWSI